MLFKSLITRLKQLFTNNYGSDIEQYIVSHNPKTTADVEQLLQQYNYRKIGPNA
jgi:hypothetical protein